MVSRTRRLTFSSSALNGDLVGARLQNDPDLLHRFLFKNLDAKLFDLRKFPHDVFNGAGKYVDATDYNHIIHPPQHATLQKQKWPAAWTRLVARLNQIAGSITDDGTADPAEIGDNQFTLFAFRYRSCRSRGSESQQ